MNIQGKMAALALVGMALGGGQAVFAQDADDAQMMTHCNTYAAKHLNVSTSDIATLRYDGTYPDGKHGVYGETSTGQTFQCVFGPHGHKVVEWTHSGYVGCPADVSQADRYMYPDCD